VSEPERPSLLRRLPVMLYPGVVFAVLGLAVHDRLTFLFGGALLVFASLQWSRGA
jgi:hypothetical protein